MSLYFFILEGFAHKERKVPQEVDENNIIFESEKEQATKQNTIEKPIEFEEKPVAENEVNLLFDILKVEQYYKKYFVLTLQCMLLL